jgi:IS5 family transposase
MLRLELLTAQPRACRSLTGHSPAELEALYQAFAPAYQRAREAARTTRRERRPRCRALGGGAQHTLGLRDRLLLALVWLKVYPTYEVLGFFFGLHKGNAYRNCREVLDVLATLEDFPFDPHPPDRPAQPRTLTEVMDAFPAVRLVIDSKEQRLHRPGGGYEAQKPYYSGKKKAHTLKTQLAVGPDGLIEAVSASVPGSVNDVRLARESGVLERLAPEQVVMVDKGYEGAGKELPVVLIIPKKDRKKNPCTEDDKARNRLIARYRIVVEHTIAQLNRFTVLRQVYRGRRQRHGRHSQVVRAVAVLANRRIRVLPLKRYGTAA